VDDLVEVHGQCGRRFATLVAGVGLGHWHDDTPCSEWDVRTLVHHLLSEQLWVPPMFEGLTIEQVGDRFEGDLMGDDTWAWPGLLASSVEEAHAVVAQPGALKRTVHLSFGDASGQEYVTQLTADLAIHAWDLARATGQDERLDPDFCAELLAGMEPLEEVIRSSGQYGPKVEVPGDADPQTKLLGFIGRDPCWVPAGSSRARRSRTAPRAGPAR
jgi:uncharacterized protein (TIGR03086 family)